MEEIILSLKVDKTKELSDDQKNGLVYLLDWANKVKKNRDDSIFCSLTGAAGTGKTTLISYFLDKITDTYSKSKICICAPTHKAKKVIQSKTKWKNSETLQALLGLKLDINLDDFDINNLQFNSIGDRKIRDFELVIIDESSMVNTDLFMTIKDCAKSTGTKILFVGDSKQLNPIKEYNVSLALTSCLNNYNLTEVVRQQNGNPLLEILNCLRLDIENNTNNYIELLKNRPKACNNSNEGYEVLNSIDFSTKLDILFKSEDFKKDKNYCRFISWTNQSITETNKWIRKSIFKETEALSLNDILLGYKTISDGDFANLVNSDDYTIKEITEKVSNYDEIQIKILLVELESIDTGQNSTVSIVKPDNNNYTSFIEVLNDLLLDAKTSRSKRGWKAFYEFKDNNLLLENLFEPNTKQLIVKKDIDYGYGITIHKSQGSTYNTVFINGKDINKNFTDSERKKLWYVALSRASNKVYINL